MDIFEFGCFIWFKSLRLQWLCIACSVCALCNTMDLVWAMRGVAKIGCFFCCWNLQCHRKILHIDVLFKQMFRQAHTYLYSNEINDVFILFRMNFSLPFIFPLLIVAELKKKRETTEREKKIRIHFFLHWNQIYTMLLIKLNTMKLELDLLLASHFFVFFLFKI